MPLLLYCICEAQAKVRPPAAGVRGAAVREMVADGLRCFYSEMGDLGRDAAAVQKDALEFYNLNNAVFRSVAIIPFRFPTLVKETSEISSFLESHASEYSQALERLRDAVQMEVRISAAGAASEKPTGAEWLRARADLLGKLGLAASQVAARGAAVKWQQRQWRDGVLCYALVRRSEVYNFEQALRELRLDEAVKVIVSGPWPATEFIEFRKVSKADSSRAEARSE